MGWGPVALGTKGGCGDGDEGLTTDGIDLSIQRCAGVVRAGLQHGCHGLPESLLQREAPGLGGRPGVCLGAPGTTCQKEVQYTVVPPSTRQWTDSGFLAYLSVLRLFCFLLVFLR